MVQPCIWFKEEQSQFSMGQIAHMLTCYIMDTPHTGLDECPRILLSCFRGKSSVSFPLPLLIRIPIAIALKKDRQRETDPKRGRRGESRSPIVSFSSAVMGSISHFQSQRSRWEGKDSRYMVTGTAAIG